MDIKQPRYDDVFYDGVAKLDADARGDAKIEYIEPDERTAEQIKAYFKAISEILDRMNAFSGLRYDDRLVANFNAPPMPEG